MHRTTKPGAGQQVGQTIFVAADCRIAIRPVADAAGGVEWQVHDAECPHPDTGMASLVGRHGTEQAAREHAARIS